MHLHGCKTDRYYGVEIKVDGVSHHQLISDSISTNTVQEPEQVE
jgi:hypothetical protein